MLRNVVLNRNREAVFIPKPFIIVVLIFCVCVGVTHAQDNECEILEMSPPMIPPPIDSVSFVNTHQSSPQWHESISNIPHDVGQCASLSVDGHTVPVLVGLTALTLGLIVTDHQTSEFTSGYYERSRTVASVSDFFVSVGDGQSPLLLAGAFGVYGFAASDRRALRTASQILEALFATGFMVQTFKHISGRESPSEATSNGGTWRPFPSLKKYGRHQSRYHAFPSGHIATTMATVTVLIENYPEHSWLKPLGYSVVGLVGIGLVGNGWHWYSDLPLGIALGYAFGRIAANSSSRDFIDQGGMKFSLAPMVNDNGNGLRASLRF